MSVHGVFVGLLALALAFTLMSYGLVLWLEGQGSVLFLNRKTEKLKNRRAGVGVHVARMSDLVSPGAV